MSLRLPLTLFAILLTDSLLLIRGASSDEPATGDLSIRPLHSQLFRLQYTIHDSEFCGSEVCADFDQDGDREFLLASRSPGRLELRNAADGSVCWSKHLPGQQQSTSAFDLDGNGQWEIVYTVSDPGRLYVCDHTGRVLRQVDSGDHKLGNSPVIFDVDNDGILDGFFGTRSRYLLRLNMQHLSTVARRTGWVQCGCYTSAMDIDRDGQWDLFAGSGDDISTKGVLHRLNPVTLESVWSYSTNDNASSADPVLADMDGDGSVEIIKSVDNYGNDDSHAGVMAFDTNGKLLWKVSDLAGEDSPNVADLDGDGHVEIIGMTFGGVVYCLNADGTIRWQRDLRPELDDSCHMYMTPILCDLNGDRRLEILAMTNGPYTDIPGDTLTARVSALDVTGNLLDELDLGQSRYWGHAYVCNIDDDPFLELVVSGRGGLDVFETRGFGSNTEHFQRRCSYQRLNVRSWDYEDTYFMGRGQKLGLDAFADNLILAQEANGDRRPEGQFLTELLTLPPQCEFRTLRFAGEVPAGTSLSADILDAQDRPLRTGLSSGADLRIQGPVRIAFRLTTTSPSVTPRLDSCRLAFDRCSSPTVESR